MHNQATLCMKQKARKKCDYGQLGSKGPHQVVRMHRT